MNDTYRGPIVLYPNRRVCRSITRPDHIEWYVNIYRTEREYGGPEEGGWWFTTGECIESRKFNEHSEATDYSEKVENEMKDPNETWCSDSKFFIEVTTRMGEHFPSHRPVYE